MRAKTALIILTLSIGGVAVAVFLRSRTEDRIYDASVPKSVTLEVDGFPMRYGNVTDGTVGAFLEAADPEIRSDDTVIPDRNVALSAGMRVTVFRKKTVTVSADGGERTMETEARTVGEALSSEGFVLRDDDLVTPSGSAFPGREATVTIVRVDIREESVEKQIEYETKTREDDTLSWRKKVVETKGKNGVRTSRYRVSRHDGKEVARTLLESAVTQEPVTEIVVQGTYVKVGKSHSGLGTWYAHTGTLAAASPWLPMGSSVKVTNRANGKSVIVTINDRGPFGTDRIIDLDKVAFAEIAPLSAGIIEVKVQEIVN